MAEEAPASRTVRIWTVTEANARLPSLRELLPQMIGWVHRLRAVHEELGRLTGFWGKELQSPDNPDRDLAKRLGGEFKSLTQRLEHEVARLHDEGIEVKDLDEGLVDFCGLVNGEIVYLCWRHDEDDVAFYHTLTGGFSGRKPLKETGGRGSMPRPRSGAPSSK